MLRIDLRPFCVLSYEEEKVCLYSVQDSMELLYTAPSITFVDTIPSLCGSRTDVILEVFVDNENRICNQEHPEA